MDLQGITSRDMSIEELLRDFYEVPDYQREYVWEDEQVEQLLADVLEEFNQKTENYNPDYFIGTIVTHYRSNDGIYELIDGQQRVTTLYVLLCALRDFLVEKGRPIQAIEGNLYNVIVDDEARETIRPRVKLQYSDDQDVLIKLAESRDRVPLEKIEATFKSAVNLMRTYRETREFLVEELEDNPERVRRFYVYLTKNVKLIRIRTETIDRALWIFETINQRGIGLDAMDLLKNLLFRNATDAQFAPLKKRWKLLVNELYEAKEKPLTFIRQLLMADYADQKIQADRIYGWMTNRDNDRRPDYWTDPVEFVDQLLAAARAYVRFSSGHLPDGERCRHLANIWHLHHTAKQHLVLMLAARHLPSAAQCSLAREIENLYFVFTVTRQSHNKFEVMFVEWAQQIRTMNSEAQLAAFVDEVIKPVRHSYAEEFTDGLRRLSDSNLRKYTMKYVLGKFAQYLDEAAYGTPQEIDHYAGRGVEVEHILPLTDTDEIVRIFGGRDAVERCKHRLANLTLLERSLNSVVSNKRFPDKLKGYAESKFIITKGLNSEVGVGDDNKIKQALSIVGSYDDWTLETFEDREDRLVRLAQTIWDTPFVKQSGAEDDPDVAE